MDNYKIKYFMKDGKIGELNFSCPEDSFEFDFCEFVREKVRADNISRLMVYKNGHLIEGEFPPIWVNHKGYVFSNRGLEKIIPFDENKHSALLADYFVDENCEGLDNVISKIDNQKFERFMENMPSGVPISYEEIIKCCGKNNRYDSSRLTSKKPSRKELFREKLISFLVSLEGKTLTKEEILSKAEEEGIFDMMRGPFKRFRLWNKVRYSDNLLGFGGVLLRKRNRGLLRDYIFFERSDKDYKGEAVYKVGRETFAHSFY